MQIVWPGSAVHGEASGASGGAAPASGSPGRLSTPRGEAAQAARDERRRKVSAREEAWCGMREGEPLGALAATARGWF
jgi:hypothetical protein